MTHNVVSIFAAVSDQGEVEFLGSGTPLHYSGQYTQDGCTWVVFAAQVSRWKVIECACPLFTFYDHTENLK